MQRINEDIRQEKFRQAYLLYGEEAYLKRQYRDKLKKALCKEEKVKYVDTTDLTDASYYGEDGSTMTKAYYEACINKILEAAFRNYVIQ